MKIADDFQKQISRLDNCLAEQWQRLLDSSLLVKAIREGNISRPLYMIYMLETYHYTSHNARNQALVGTRSSVSPVYSKFCLQHASEEVGHEKMALHDIASMGFRGNEGSIPPPLPETETLIAYLYWISLTGNPLQRMGYSYWAENAYQYINPLILGVKNALNLNDQQLTFFVAHGTIDTEHFAEIKTILERTCKTEEDWASVRRVMQTSLSLTGKMLDAVYREYRAFEDGLSEHYDVLNELSAA